MEHNWALSQYSVALESFKKRSRSGSQNKNKETHGSMSKHTKGAFSCVNYAKHLVRAHCYIFYYFY